MRESKVIKLMQVMNSSFNVKVDALDEEGKDKVRNKWEEKLNAAPGKVCIARAMVLLDKAHEETQ